MSFPVECDFKSPVDTLLDQDDCSVDLLLDEPSIFQECKSQNPRLMDFVIDYDHLEQIVKYVSSIPEANCDDIHRIKYPQICCDILSAKIWTITEALFQNPSLLKLLIGFLDNDPDDVNEEQAKITNNCSKIISSLLNVRLDDFVKFLQTVPRCIEGLVRHMSNPSVMVVLQKLITLDGPMINENDSTNWLCEQRLVEQLLAKYISADGDQGLRDQIAQTFQDLISAASYSPTDFVSTPDIIVSFESDHVAKMFVPLVFESDDEDVILSSLSILTELVNKRRTIVYNGKRDLKKIPGVVVEFSSRFSDCKTFLLSKCPSSSLNLPCHTIDPPFGRIRQAMMDFLDAIFNVNNAFVFDSVVSTGLIPLIIDFFFQYKWNNFLQQSVFSILSILLLSPDEKIVRYVIQDCHLVERILAAESENKEFFLKTNYSYGYISFLTKLSMLISELNQHHSFIDEVLFSYPGWKEYFVDVIVPRNNLESQALGSVIIALAE